MGDNAFIRILENESLSYPEKAVECIRYSQSNAIAAYGRKELELGAIVFAILAVGEQISLASQDAL